jgi:hypothetical protein
VSLAKEALSCAKPVHVASKRHHEKKNFFMF